MNIIRFYRQFGHLKAIEKIWKFYILNLRIMKNSRMKLQRQTTSHPYLIYQTHQNIPCPESKDQHQDRFTIPISTYESDLNYFTGRMAKQFQHQQKQGSHAHQRHASLGNSRMLGPSERIIASPTLSPYLEFNSKQYWNHEAVSRNGFKGDQQNKQLTKQPNKLSMKNFFKDNRSGKCGASSIIRDSQASTFQQTNNSGNKVGRQGAIDPEMYGYFKSLMQKRANQFKNQIEEQSSLILNLQSQIAALSMKLKQKQQQIGKAKPENLQQMQQPITHLNKKMLTIEQEFNIHIKHRLNQQAQLQNKLNLKINQILQAFKVLISIKASRTSQTAVGFDQAGSRMAKIRQVFMENKKLLCQFTQIHKTIYSLTKSCYKIKQVISKGFKEEQSQNLFNQTAEFGPKPKERYSKEGQIEGKQKNELNESASYFFHPSELSNFDKFTQIFINRQGEPIRCYTDSLNQVRYKDTHTFMFNKKGDVVTLTQNEKRYYIDKGFIAQGS